MALLRHGAMGRVFANAYAPSTLGSFLRAFSFGHVRQLDAIASRFLTRLATRTPLIAQADRSGGPVPRLSVEPGLREHLELDYIAAHQSALY